jgi:quercetin dioxygenase-like cupin family protein
MSADLWHGSAEQGWFVTLDDVEYLVPMPGQKCRPLLGEQMLANVVYFEPHAVAPVHSHLEEQIVVVLDGEFEYEVGGRVQVMRKGDVALIPPWVPHGARVGDLACVELEIFTPPRATVMHHAIQERQRLRGDARD